jgi:hypothetical protein
VATDSTLTPAGLLLPDPRLRTTSALWAAESSYTEADRRPGVPVGAADSLLVLEASGDEQTTEGDLTAIVLEGGYPGATSGAPTVGYQREGETVRGWEAPATISASRWVAYGSPTAYTAPVPLGLPSGRVAVAACSSTALLVWLSDDEGLTWTGPTTVWTGAGTSPALVYSPEVGLLLLVLTTTGSTQRARVYRSSDEGDTWTLHARGVTPLLASERWTVASSGRELLAVTHHHSAPAGPPHGEDILYQYLSSDWGATWTEVSSRRESDVDDGSGWPSLAARPGGGYVLAWVGTVSSSEGVVRVALLSSGAEPLGSVDPLDTSLPPGGGDWATSPATVTTSAGVWTLASADLTVVVDDAGQGWLLVRVADTAAAVPYRHSWSVIWSPDCETWRPWGLDPLDSTDEGLGASWWRSADTGPHYPWRARACYHRGRLLVAHGYVAQEGGAGGSSVIVTQLGGPSTVAQPRIRSASEPQHRAHWDRTHLPWERLPDTSDWTHATTGISSWSVNAAGYEAVTSGDGVGTAGSTAVTWTATASAAAHLAAHYEVRATQVASVATPQVAWEGRLDDGTTQVQVSVRHLPGTVALYDDLGGGGAGAALAAWASLDTGLTVQVRVAVSLDGTACRVWWRQPGAPLEVDREWTELGTGPHTLTTAATAGAGHRLRLGHLASSGAGSQTRSRWYAHHHTLATEGATDGASLAGVEGRWEEAAPEDYLPGRPLSGSPAWLADGVHLSASTGPAAELEEATITPLADRPVSRIWPSVALSPRDGLRLEGGSEHTIALRLYEGATAYDCELPVVTAVALYGCNFQTATLQGHTSGSWTTLGTIDLSGGLTLGCTRRGNALVPSSVGTVRLQPAELAGATIKIGTDYRRVLRSTEGLWSSTTDGPVPQILLSGVDGTESSSATCTPIYTGGVYLLAPGSTRYAGLRIVIPVQDTVDGWVSLGSLLVCRVVPLQRPDWGSQHEVRWARDTEVTPTGRTVLTPLGPSARVVEIDWAEVGTDTTDTWRAALGGSYERAGPTQPGATRGALARELQALSSADPVVYLPQLSPDTALPRMVVRPWAHLLAVPQGAPVMQQVLGTWHSDEVVTVSALTLQELV